MFPGAEAAAVRGILDRYGTTPNQPGRERVQRAALKLSEGDPDRLRSLVEAARRDFRDVLYWADLAEGHVDPVTDRLFGALLTPTLTPRRLALLQGAVPSLSRVAVLWNPGNAFHPPQLAALDTTSRELGLTLRPIAVSRPAAFDEAFAAARREQADGLVVLASALHQYHPRRLADLALSSRLASICEFERFARAGGLMSSGPRPAELGRRATAHIRRALRDGQPRGPEHEEPTIELVINLRTAGALGLMIPREILLRATELIE